MKRQVSWCRSLLVVWLLMYLGGCAEKNRYDDLCGVSQADVVAIRDKRTESGPSIGLAFGGGGVRGFAHLGVIRALDEAGIYADLVTGSSVGAIAAVLYASGMEYEDIEAAVLSVKPADVTDVVFSDEGRVNGRALAEWINGVTGNRSLEQLSLPTGITVTDMTHHESLLIVEGDVGRAVQASVTIPGTLVPVEVNGSVWVDGGLLSLVPVRFARKLGADIVIGVDVLCGFPLPLKGGRAGMLTATLQLQSCVAAEPEMMEADYLIRPGVSAGAGRTYRNRKDAIDAGYQAGREFVKMFISR
ncbi:patatin-like phospholipase family protein [Desulfopila sp. IMCC35008]|uniref:patatin-like phospholipase family protein n=1 Tax=Desulfopila sp. IMCC35008 TaxID=2653858 RepID=UPI0013CF5403|nr:patatin-like phospholipase family protein [Desulfopila sp. IMCC35008]